MKTRLLVSLVCWTVITLVGNVDAKDILRRVIVWRLEAKSGVSQQDIDSISGVLTAEVAKASRAKVLGESDIVAYLRTEERKVQCGSDTNCMVEISNALGAEEIVYGDLGKVGKLWILNLVRMNAIKAEVINRITRMIKGSIEQVVLEIPFAVAELYGNKETSKPVVVKKQTKKQAQSTSVDFRKTSYWVLGGAVLSLVFGGISHGVALKYADDYKSGDWEAYDKNGVWSALAITGYSLGGVLATVGTVLFFVDGDSDFDVVMAPSKNGATVNLKWRW